jgi:SAM-dependent methyltransferase
VETGDFVVGNANDIRRLWPQPVDFVSLASAFHGVADRLQLARSARDALKPSGRFAIINWRPWPREKTTVLGEPRSPRTQSDHTMQNWLILGVQSGMTPPYHRGVVFERT